jgi:MFS family permease
MKLRATWTHPKIEWNKFISAFILIVNSFSWYSFMSVVFTSVVDNLQIALPETFCLFGVFYTGVAVSAILGHYLFRRSRKSLLLLWFFLGIIASMLFNLIEIGIYSVALAVSLFQGISIGLGLPSALAYFADLTSFETRGRLGGLTYGVSAIAMFILLYSWISLGSSVSLLVLPIWRGLGLVLFMLFMRRVNVENSQSVPSNASIIGDRRLILYLVPWIMFCLVNWIEAPIVEAAFGEIYSFVISAEFAISAISALIGGIFADLVGRKRGIIAGFILLGTEYAVLSLLPTDIFSQYLYLILDGISWGMFSVVFFMVLWGDLAEGNRKEKYYVVGGLPYLLSNFLSVLVKPYIAIITDNVNTAFSVASFFLFLAVLPLMYAPETLPEKKIKERELKKYIEKAQKEAAKAHKNEDENGQKEDTDNGIEIEVNKDLEDALKEAEKYY